MLSKKNNEKLASIKKQIDELDAVAQARFLVYMELFDLEVAKQYEKLTKPALWDKIFPWSITITRKDND